jgi:Helix-turn-helix of DDE superfamily endonuclease
MLIYTTLKDRPRDFLAATGLTHEEFLRVLPAFVAAYTACYPLDKTWQGKVRQRKLGGGAKGLLSQMEDKLLFILVYQKTNPLQTIHGLHFGLSQPQTNYWIHRLLPVLRRALVPRFRNNVMVFGPVLLPQWEALRWSLRSLSPKDVSHAWSPTELPP